MRVEDLILATSRHWRRLEAAHSYHLQPLFRAWFYVYQEIRQAAFLGIEPESEWEEAAKFRAQLSSIELTYLLANLVFSPGIDEKGYPKAMELAERYAAFANLDVNFEHGQFICELAAGRTSAWGLNDNAYVVRKFDETAFDSSAAKNKLRQPTV